MHHVWKKGEHLQLSKNFSTTELECRCKLKSCVDQKISQELIVKLQALRDLIGPLTVVSGIRCPEHNQNIGGAKKSNHVEGLACDFQDSIGQPLAKLVTEAVLIQTDLYMEHPSKTMNWVHVQSNRVPSGKRIFLP